MPNDVQHISHAKHNYAFLHSFYNNYHFNDWSVTVCFYIAVHIVEAVIFNIKKISLGGNSYTIDHSEQLMQNFSHQISYHQVRANIVRDNFPSISHWYRMLYNDSKTARYKSYSFNSGYSAFDY